MIDYILRNDNGKEIKRREKRNVALWRWTDMSYRKQKKIPDGYQLSQVVDYRVTAKERKAK